MGRNRFHLFGENWEENRKRKALDDVQRRGMRRRRKAGGGAAGEGEGEGGRGGGMARVGAGEEVWRG